MVYRVSRIYMDSVSKIETLIVGRKRETSSLSEYYNTIKMNNANVTKSIGPGYIGDSAMYNPNVYGAVESMLADIHAEFAAKRDTFEKRWLGIRPPQIADGYVSGENGIAFEKSEEIDAFPIELREKHRAKWVKLANCVYTRNDDIVFYDETHIDAGWNYLLVSHTPVVDVPSVFDLLDYRYVNVGIVEEILRNHNEETTAMVNRLPMPPCEREICMDANARIMLEEDYDAGNDANRENHVSRNAWVDEILEERSAREEEPDNLEKDWRTFGCTIPWEHEPFDAIV
jgi:hypothetical protein